MLRERKRVLVKLAAEPADVAAQAVVDTGDKGFGLLRHLNHVKRRIYIPL